MNYGEDDGGSEVELETLHGRSWPTVTQYSVFLENRVGQLLEVYRSFPGIARQDRRADDLRLGRLLDPAVDREPFRARPGNPGLATSTRSPRTSCWSSSCPPARSRLSDLCMALLQAEINIHYAYPLIVHPRNRPAVAMHIDNVEQAERDAAQHGI